MGCAIAYNRYFYSITPYKWVVQEQNPSTKSKNKKQNKGMKKQVFLDFDVKFNLRQNKENKPSIVYAVVNFHSRQWKINIGAKVYPAHWNHKKQIAKCSGGMSQLDVHNNLIVNNKLREILLVSEDLKNYLCENIGSINNMYSILKQYINPNMKEKKMKKKINQNAILALRQVIERRNCEQSTKNTYFSQLKKFEQFLKVKNIINDLSSLNLTILNQYQNYLYENDKGQVSTAGLYCTSLISVIKELEDYPEYEFDYNAVWLHKFKIRQSKISKAQKQTKQVILTEEQLQFLYNCKDLKSNEEEARDLFILQCLVGQRISDMPQFFINGYETETVDGIDLIKIFQKKVDETAIIPIFPIAKEILKKYENKTNFHYLNLEENGYNCNINGVIKRVGNKSGLTYNVTFTDEPISGVVRITKPLYELLHTHTARHNSFSSRLKTSKLREIFS